MFNFNFGNAVSSKVAPAGGDIELVSHWIGIPSIPDPIVNEVGGKPGLTPRIAEGVDWLPALGWANNTGGQAPTLATGTIHATESDYTFVMAHHTGSGHNVNVNQRFISAEDSGNVERIDLQAFPKADDTKCFESSVVAIGVDNLPISAIEPDVTNKIFTIIFEEPNIKIYKNSVSVGTLSDVYAKCKLDGKLAFGQWYNGSTNGYLACSWAECKIFAGVLDNTTRLAEESAMASTWGITL
jgi:hypothetical protein